jgi:hypothetical protein
MVEIFSIIKDVLFRLKKIDLYIYLITGRREREILAKD